MLTIDFNEKFTVDVDRTSFMDREVFDSVIDFFKSLYLSFDPVSKKWIIPTKRIDEVCLWFNRVEYTYTLTANAIIQLKDIAKQYDTETKFFHGRFLDFSIYNENQKPYQFQVEDINIRLKRSAYLDANDAGLGKSFVNISVASQNYKNGFIDSIIIICPSGMTFHWKYEILKFVNVFKEDDIEIILNDNKNKPFDFYQDKKILIISNNTKVLADALLSYKRGFKFGDSTKSIKWSLYKPDIKKLWNKKSIMLIVDECHAFQHSDSVRTKALKSIKHNFEYRTLLSATPNINHFENIYSQLNIIDSSIIPMSENAFKISISKQIGSNYGIYDIVEYDTESILKIKSKWDRNFFQRLKEDVPEMKAKRIIKEIYFDSTPLQKKLYSLIVEREISVLQEEFDVITWKMFKSKFHLICEIFDNASLLKKRYYSDKELQAILSKWSLEYDPKFISLKEKLDDYINNRNEKVVIFDHHPSTLDELYTRFNKYNPVIIHGSLSGIKNKEDDRQIKQDIFNNDPNCKLIILSSLTSSAGLNLQKNCHRVIVYSMPDSGVHFRQLIDRTHRINSTEDSIIEVFCYPNTIDNIRVQRNLGRIEYNDSMNKELTQEDLQKLLNGKIN